MHDLLHGTCVKVDRSTRENLLPPGCWKAGNQLVSDGVFLGNAMKIYKIQRATIWGGFLGETIDVDLGDGLWHWAKHT